MPAAVVVPAAASLAGTAFSGIMQNSANKRASRDQQRANDQALAWEKQKYEDQKRLMEEDRMWKRWAREQLGQRFGFEMPSAVTLGNIGAPPVGRTRVGPPVVTGRPDARGLDGTEAALRRYDPEAYDAEHEG